MESIVQRIPEEHLVGLQDLASLDDRTADEFINLVQTLPPFLDFSDLALEISNRMDSLSENSIGEIISVLFSLYALGDETNMNAAEIAEGIREITEGDERISLTKEQLLRMEVRLTQLISSDSSIGSSYKAGSILTDHKHVFADARIFTDLRPIFPSDSSTDTKPLAIGIVHNLKVSYLGLSGRDEFFVALDTTELISLAMEIERAIKKEESIRTLLTRADIHCLGENFSN